MCSPNFWKTEKKQGWKERQATRRLMCFCTLPKPRALLNIHITHVKVSSFSFRCCNNVLVYHLHTKKRNSCVPKKTGREQTRIYCACRPLEELPPRCSIFKKNGCKTRLLRNSSSLTLLTNARLGWWLVSSSQMLGLLHELKHVCVCV